MILLTGWIISWSLRVSGQMQPSDGSESTSILGLHEVLDAQPVDIQHHHQQSLQNYQTHHRQKSSISSLGQSEVDWFDALEDHPEESSQDSLEPFAFSDLPNGMKADILGRYIKDEPFTRDQLILAFKSPISRTFVHEALVSGNPQVSLHLPFVIMSLLRDDTRNHKETLQTIFDHPKLVYFGKKLYNQKDYIMDLQTFSMVALSALSGYRGPNDLSSSGKLWLSSLNSQPFINYILKLKDLFAQANGSRRPSEDGSRTSLEVISDNVNALDINVERDSLASPAEPYISIESGRSFDKISASLILQQFLVWAAGENKQDIVTSLLEEHVFGSIFRQTEFGQRELELAMIQAIRIGDPELVQRFLQPHVLDLLKDLTAVTQAVVTESSFEVANLFISNERTGPLTQILLQINDGAQKIELG
jgi:hypothetical protein